MINLGSKWKTGSENYNFEVKENLDGHIITVEDE